MIIIIIIIRWAQCMQTGRRQATDTARRKDSARQKEKTDRHRRDVYAQSPY